MARKPVEKRTTSRKSNIVNKKVSNKRTITNKLSQKDNMKEKASEEVLLNKETEHLPKAIEESANTVQNQKAKKKTNVLIAAPEGMPFITTGGLGEVVGSLPKAIMKENNEQFDVRVVLPLYESITIEDRQQMDFLGHFNVQLAWREQYCGVFRTTRNGVIYYFIDNEYYFKRSNVYGHYDDGERFAFFSKAVLDSITLMDFSPDIIHCHDWQTALIPVYLHYNYSHIHAKTAFTIHNIEYQGKYDFHMISDVFGLPTEARDVLEYDKCVNLMKAAIECSNQVNTVSPTYAWELRDDQYAKGLGDIIRKNEFKMRGILNGIDVDSYNPNTDSSLFMKYNTDSIENKKVNKSELQKLVQLPVEEKTPLIAIISRLVSHKGLDLMKDMMEQLLNENVQVVVLGIGDQQYEDYFKWLQNKYPNKVATLLCFNSDLARKIYAGADFFLMPSKSEPCGLAQMISSRYGTVPIVRAVGGLRDTIKDCSVGEGNGFVFERYNAGDLLETIHRGFSVYYNENDWNQLKKWIMSLDFSWEKSAREYENMYVQLFHNEI